MAEEGLRQEAAAPRRHRPIIAFLLRIYVRSEDGSLPSADNIVPFPMRAWSQIDSNEFLMRRPPPPNTGVPVRNQSIDRKEA